MYVTGELPWDEPSNTCQEYCDWLDRKVHLSPWSKIDTGPLALLRKILQESPEKRLTISSIKKDRYCTQRLFYVVHLVSGGLALLYRLDHTVAAAWYEGKGEYISMVNLYWALA